MSTLLIINQWHGILVIKLAQYTKRQRTVGEAVFQNTLFYLQMCVCEYLYIATSKRREVSVILRRHPFSGVDEQVEWSKAISSCEAKGAVSGAYPQNIHSI